MAIPNNFNEYFKTISNIELLSIIDNPKDYQLLAVEAAKEELANRQLSDIEIQEARQPLIAKQLQKEKEREKRKWMNQSFQSAYGRRQINNLDVMDKNVPKL